ncbi:hypothetical protein DFH05DRAFT_1593490 [Lentinula detonsa]|uniref:Uncharacterized protein n=1 Tax=Lentinula detonsa TaxID=2804962 RepID=A0A9W8P9D7_9AGAR|nr:hypothetical protein DFH05DRAFT_1593490 [Lentinula detonsa]
MMVYKYWNGHNFQHEDLKFSVGSKAAVWEVKNPLLSGSAGYPGGSSWGKYSEEDVRSNYGGYAPPPSFGNNKTASLVSGVSGAQLYNRKSYGAGGRGYPPAG